MEFNRTGSIWKQPVRRRSQIARRVCETFESVYGHPRLGNPRNPVDDLVYIVLSNKTGPKAAASVFRSLRARFDTWEILLDSRIATVRRILQPAGLAKVKTRQLRNALRKIRRDFGKCSLNDLKRFSCHEAETYLTSLDGVSEKVAKCVMMYTLGFEVLPVDSHVHRVACRLGWTARKRADQCHAELEALVKPHHRYVFHVGCIVHSRAICHSTKPSCETCAIRRHCEYYQQRRNEKR